MPISLLLIIEFLDTPNSGIWVFWANFEHFWVKIALFSSNWSPIWGSVSLSKALFSIGDLILFKKFVFSVFTRMPTLATSPKPVCCQGRWCGGKFGREWGGREGQDRFGQLRQSFWGHWRGETSPPPLYVHLNGSLQSTIRLCQANTLISSNQNPTISRNINKEH